MNLGSIWSLYSFQCAGSLYAEMLIFTWMILKIQTWLNSIFFMAVLVCIPTHSSGHTLDIVLTQQHESVSSVDVYDDLISDL